MASDHEFDLIDIIDSLNKEISSLQAMHLMLHTYIKNSALSKEPKMSPSELRVFNTGIDNLASATFSNVAKLINKITNCK